LLEATEKELNKIVAATTRKRGRLAGKEQIGLRVGKVLGHYKVGKHFRLRITDDGSSMSVPSRRSRPKQRSTASTSSAPACRCPIQC